MRLKIVVLTSIFCAIGLISLFATSTISTWVKDMYNQVSIKPQESGGISSFPQNSVTTKGVVYQPNLAPFDNQNIDYSKYQSAPVPVSDYVFESENGQKMFLTYCAVCHGIDGQLNQGKGTKISQKGLKVAVIKDLPRGYYFERLKRGGVQMPSIGFRLSEQERWHVATYIAECLHLKESCKQNSKLRNQ